MNLRDSLIQAKADGSTVLSLTAYDYVFARLLDEQGLDFILVGDSLGMVQLGMRDTVEVTMEDMLVHLRGVLRGAKQTPVVADLPFGSYGNVDDARRNAAVLVQAGAVGVKLEGGEGVLPQVEALVKEGITVIGHLGMLPQQVRKEGGYREKGKTEEERQRLLFETAALSSAGVGAIVAELVDPETCSMMAQSGPVPVIGIGSGSDCDGQILVTHDLVGFFPWFRPRFVQPTGNLAEAFRQSVTAYVEKARHA